MNRLRSTALLFLCAYGSFAQTGPAGVGSTASNFLWLDAGSGITLTGGAVSAWNDRSGNGNHATQATAAQRPTLASSLMNGRPAVQFDNDNTNPDFLRIPDNSTLEGMSGLTAFAVYRLSSGSAISAPRSIFSKRVAPDNQEAYAWFIYNGGSTSTTRRQTLDIDGTNNRFSGSTNVTDGTDLLQSFVYKGSSPSASTNQTLYDGNTAIGNSAENSASVPNYASDLYLGSLNGNSSSIFNGHICEVICYNQALNDAQRIIVNNYLAAKYGISLASFDLYQGDTPANGDFDFEVAGIGRTSSTSMQLDSRGSGVVAISSPTDLNDNEFLFWGHDNKAMGTYGVADKPSGLQGRWQRTWRVSELNSSLAATDVGAVDVTFDLTGLGTVTASDLRLIVDTDKDNTFSDETPISGASLVSEGVYRFSGVTALTNGTRFTLGTTSSNTPLPIELVSFGAAAQADGSVLVRWTTASEQDNALFSIERSADATEWTSIASRPGAGNSSAMLDYACADGSPLNGLSYYRLKQFDTDGASSVSDIVPVVLDAPDRITASPNPAEGSVTISAPTLADATVLLLDGQGRPAAAPVRLHGGQATIDVSSLTQGIYYLRSTGDVSGGACRLMVR